MHVLLATDCSGRPLAHHRPWCAVVRARRTAQHNSAVSHSTAGLKKNSKKYRRTETLYNQNLLVLCGVVN